MKFSIRDLLLMTVIAAVALCWVLERRRAERFSIQARDALREAESSLALSEALTQQLKNKNPAANIEISVRGRGSTTSATFGAPAATPSLGVQPAPLDSHNP